MTPLKYSRAIATKVVSELSQFCERIEIAGSIRRGRDLVHDIDLVVIPKPGMENAIDHRCRQNSERLSFGPKQARYRLPFGDQLDLYFARPESEDLFSQIPSNWGSLLLCRTGSREHNIYLVQEAKSKGLEWRTTEGLFRDGEWVAGRTEEEIFDALRLDFIPPESRER